MCQRLMFLVACIFCFEKFYVYAALTEDERANMDEPLEAAFVKCIEELKISPETEEALRAGSNVDYDSCLDKCMFTNLEMVTDELFDVEKSMEFSKLYTKNSEELSRLQKIRQECSKVNEAKVKDACERFKLLYDCLEEHDDDLTLLE